MYIQFKGKNAPIKGIIQPGTNQTYSCVNYDTILSFDNQKIRFEDLETMKKFEVCTATGQSVCSLDDMARAMYTADIRYVNEHIEVEIEKLSQFAERNNGKPLLVASKYSDQAIGLANPTLKELGSIAVNYNLLGLHNMDTHGDFNDRFADLFSKIDRTNYAVQNIQIIGNDFTLIRGTDLLSTAQILRDYNVDSHNLIVADSSRNIEINDINNEIEEDLALAVSDTDTILHRWIGDEFTDLEIELNGGADYNKVLGRVIECIEEFTQDLSRNGPGTTLSNEYESLSNSDDYETPGNL